MISQTITWNLSSEKAHPDKTGLRDYEHIDCMVIHSKRGKMFLLWNCEHLCWDDDGGDDYFCDASDVLAWAEIPSAPKEILEAIK